MVFRTYGSTSDDYETPFEAWELVFDSLPILKSKVWRPFYCEGGLNEHLDRLHVDYYHEDRNFYDYEPEDYDVIIDIPPYSTKKTVIERCLKLGKPFALLVPWDTLERKYFRDLICADKLTVLMPNKRYNYVGGQNKKNCPFKSVWVCYGFDIKSGIVFEESEVRSKTAKEAEKKQPDLKKGTTVEQAETEQLKRAEKEEAKQAKKSAKDQAKMAEKVGEAELKKEKNDARANGQRRMRERHMLPKVRAVLICVSGSTVYS